MKRIITVEKSKVYNPNTKQWENLKIINTKIIEQVKDNGSSSGSKEEIIEMPKKGAKSNNALIKAATERDIEKINKLLNDSENLKVKDGNGGTVLHYIAWLDDEKILKPIVDKCSEEGLLDECNSYGDRALWNAVYRKNSILIKLLLESGAKVRFKSFEKIDTVLHCASKIDDKEVLKLLVEKASKEGIINWKNAQSATALDLAIREKNYALVELLKTNNALYKIESWEGILINNTPIKDQKIIELFETELGGNNTDSEEY